MRIARPSLPDHALRRVALLAVLAGSVCGLPARAQTHGLSTFGESVEVRVINLEVVVTQGRERVRGLGRGDFRLEIDGEPVPIDLFAEVSAGRSAGAAGAPVGTHLLVFVDDYFALPAERNRVLAAIARELPRLGPDDRVAIVAFDGRRLEQLSGLTRSLPQLQTAFEQARGRAAFGLQRRGEQRRYDSVLRIVPRSGASFSRTGFAGAARGSRELGAADLARAKEVAIQLGRVVAAGSAALRAFAGTPGRKVMLLLAGGWPISPAVWQAGALEEPASKEGLVEGRRLLAPLIDTANRLGFTLYPVDVPGHGAGGVDAEDAGFAAFDARALEERREEIEQDALATLAARTGGRVLYGGARLDPLSHVLRDLEHYYWLGFTPRLQRDGREHRVGVRLARAGLDVRARTSYLDLTRSAEVSMLLESAQLLDQPLPEAGRLALVLGTPTPAGRGRIRLPIEVSAPWSEWLLAPAPEGLAAELELRAVALDDEGAISDVPVVAARLTRSTPPAPGERFVYTVELELRRREQSLLVALYQPASGKLLAARGRVIP